MWVITFRDLPNFLLGSLGVDDLVLSLNPVLDLLPELLLHHLVLLEQRSESSLDSLDLRLHRLVAFGVLEEALDLVFALFTGSSGLVVELVGVAGGRGVGRRLKSVSVDRVC